MKPAIVALLCFGAFASPSFAAEPAPVKPHPVTLTFFISGMECAACEAFICQSVQQVKSVTGITVDQLGGYANVSFDTHVSSAHQIAQAVADAVPVHGRPYEATMKVRVPDYAKDGNAARVDAVFARRADWVKVETLDKAKGDFLIRFQPLKADKSKSGPQGWNPGHFGHAVHDPAPKGLGLGFTLVKEGQTAAGKK